MDMKQSSDHYCLGTKFIDDKLLRTVNHIDGLKQMAWTPVHIGLVGQLSTIIFNISPERVFKRAAEKLQVVGAKIPRSCVSLHVPLESSNIQQSLRAKGFNGNRPSIWATQGLPVMTLASFDYILLTVSGSAMNGCFFLGELPAWLAETEIGIKCKEMDGEIIHEQWLSDEEVARSLGKDLASGGYKNILFSAEQLRFSDDQFDRGPIQFYKDYVFLALCYGSKVESMSGLTTMP
ncbi:S-adenosyl-L-methionine-dependent methyltransferases superfamily protein, partial [Prunus dulcis]